MTTTQTINPFYPSAPHPVTPAREAPRSGPVYARLPRAPRTASPVPELTSLYHNAEPGPYGDRRYPGNCPGNLIKDLLRFYRPDRVFDPMAGSGTCRDVCRELDIPCVSADLRHGQDACSPAGYPRATRFPFVWAHPPYWRQKLYTTDARDLSRQPTLEAFLDGYGRFLANAAAVLEPGGRLAVLMGDYCDREAGFVPLVYWTKHLAFAAGLRQCATDIIRFGHGASSARKVYASSFIPGLHDTCCVFQKPAAGE